MAKSKSKSYNIALMPGDGTGPEVLAEGLKVLKTAGEKYGVKLNLEKYDFGGERYKKTGETLPHSATRMRPDRTTCRHRPPIRDPSCQFVDKTTVCRRASLSHEETRGQSLLFAIYGLGG